MNTQHTTGPWALRALPDHLEVFPVNVSGLRPTLASIQKWPREGVNESNANARLIAAAPDLLETLKAFSDYVRQEQMATDGAVTYSTTAINHWAFLARAAIAKATS